MSEFLLTPLPSYVYTLFALGLVAFFGIRGFFRGAVKEYLSIVSLILCIPLAKPFGWMVRPLTPFGSLPEMFEDPLDEVVGGLVAYVFLIIIFAIAHRYFAGKYELPEKYRIWMKLAGASTGSLFAVLLVLITSWFALTVGDIARVAMQQRDKQHNAAGSELLLLPTRMIDVHSQGLEESFVGGVASETNPVPDEVTDGLDIATEILEEPEKMRELMESEPMQELLTTDAVEEYMENEEIKEMAEDGDLFGILKHPATNEMLNDPKLQEKIEEIEVNEILEMLETETSILEEPEKVQEIMENDAVERILANPEIQQLAAEGNIAGILSHPAMQELLNDPDFNPDELMEVLSN